MSLTSEGMKANNIRTRRIPMGSKRSKVGGGATGGRTSGRSSRAAARQAIARKNSGLKWVEGKVLLFVPLNSTFLLLCLPVPSNHYSYLLLFNRFHSNIKSFFQFHQIHITNPSEKRAKTAT
ncbi:hypothetical protein HPP92_001746 [Vanilla planifolia]|uniref:Uncharacterized protein n=1 Tax=Vanilla planifolia TaxID=51239 RepID=A0A835S547_VANPL|nr:hypothetical protein HPP92_001746 [Vanilla planifolia]